MQNDKISVIPLGGIGDVTKNMYVYEYGDKILIVDCGLGFADPAMIGVDLLLPDITYLLQTKKQIVGMLLTHGHEDHIGALPFILPQLPQFPIFATPFTAALANEKLREFQIGRTITAVPFEKEDTAIGPFSATFIRVTHSVPDTSHIFIKTPIGNFYHGSDYKFDDTPADGKVSEYEKIKRLSSQGVIGLFSDCLGAERVGRTPTEVTIQDSFAKYIKDCKGKFIITTYSSNVARLNQIVKVSEDAGRHVCFVGRSLIKVKDVAQKIGYLAMKQGTEVQLDQIGNYDDSKLTFIIAGSQGQENSALTRIANGEHREVKLDEDDLIIFSADPIPGNEKPVYEVVDTITKQGVKVLYVTITKEFHVSGHGSLEELKQLIELVKPKKLMPIGGSFRHMFVYKNLAESLQFKKQDIFLVEDGQEVIFSRDSAALGRLIPIKNVYVDEISGEELENFVLRDRQKLSEGGVIIVLAEVDANNGQIVDTPDIIMRGFVSGEDTNRLAKRLISDLRKALSGKKGRVTNWGHIRKMVGDISERRVFQELRIRPLVLPIVIEV